MVAPPKTPGKSEEPGRRAHGWKTAALKKAKPTGATDRPRPVTHRHEGLPVPLPLTAKAAVIRAVVAAFGVLPAPAPVAAPPGVHPAIPAVPAAVPVPEEAAEGNYGVFNEKNRLAGHSSFNYFQRLLHNDETPDGGG